jgi:ubiquinone biosynthesis protein
MSQFQEETGGNASKRFIEILSVLKKHHLTKGLSPVKLREILEELGPTFVKIGQMLSMRSDLIPKNYCKELEKLRTTVDPVDFNTVCSIIESELSRPIGDIFSRIEKIPIGSASIAQVHSAVLKTGEKVVIKVQRPNIKAIMSDDIKLLLNNSSILKLALHTGDLVDIKAIINELWQTSQTEMDFLQEARNLDLFRKNSEGIVYVTSPVVFHEFTTDKVLVMSHIEGIQIDNISRLEDLGYDMDEIAQKTAENYCKQILDDCFFHADPHPGNITITNGKIAWIDFGMAGTVSPLVQTVLKKVINSVLSDDMYGITDAFLMLGTPEEDVNRSRLVSQITVIVSRYKTKDFGSFDFAPLVEELLAIIRDNKIKIPPEVSLLSRSMVTMEGTIGLISPNVNVTQILASHMLSQNMDLKKEIKSDAKQIYSSYKRMLEIPSQLSDILQMTKAGHLSVETVSSFSPSVSKAKDRHISVIVLAILVFACYISASILTLSPLYYLLSPLFIVSCGGYIIGTFFMIILLIDITKSNRSDG